MMLSARISPAQRAMLYPVSDGKSRRAQFRAVNRAKRLDVRLSRRRGLLQKSHRSGYNVQNKPHAVVLAVLAFSPRRIQRNRGCVLRTSARCAAISAVTQKTTLRCVECGFAYCDTCFRRRIRKSHVNGEWVEKYGLVLPSHSST